MTRVKISFLFLMGVSIVIIALLRESDNKIEFQQPETLALSWDGNQITVITDKYNTKRSALNNALPPEVCPVFFHPIPLNHADEELLVTLPGVGITTAELILRKRLELGRIANRNQLVSIKGVGQKTAEIIERYTTYD